SEILSSNGSSSMATVCASTLSLMDAGVPIKKPVAGIAMGLMMNDDASKFKVLTDLAGAEDHYGDMDFKVAGTVDGVNAVQLDVKVNGLTLEIIKQTLMQARTARMEILSFMKTVINAPRPKLSIYAPVIIRLSINPDKIGMVIGPGGKMINGLIKTYELETIDIEEDGSVFIAANVLEKAEKAANDIRMMIKEFTVGEIVEGPVIKLLDFGAIVDLGGGRDGMIHVSELKDEFVKSVGDVIKVGDHVRAKIIRVDADGHIGLSLKRMKE
ncbi:MAG: S1 RNA-binding domain-containing protein, partial [Candidatus Liptonbacteria bacterium]